MAGVAGLEPVTSAVTGQRSNQLSYTPARAPRLLGEIAWPSTKVSIRQKKRFGQQTPRRWGWGTPLKKRTAARIKICREVSPNGDDVNMALNISLKFFAGVWGSVRGTRDGEVAEGVASLLRPEIAL